MSRVVIIASSRLGREALSRLLRQSPLEVVGTAVDDPAEIAAVVSRRQPGVVLVDLDQPERVTMVLDQVRSAARDARIAVLGTSRNHRHVLSVFAHGANGYLLRERASDQLLSSLSQIAAGGVVIDSSITAVLVRAATRTCRVAGPYGLSRQEMLILGQLTRRLTNGQIGQELGISTYTVKSHLRSTYHKLDVRDRHEAALFALQHGLA